MDDGSEFESWQALTGLLQVSDAGSKLQNWTSSKPISEWESVKSSDMGKVLELNMQNKNVRGRIPASFGRLTYLHTLRLDNNAFTGEIPVEVIGLLPQLTTFNISGGGNNFKLPSNIEVLGTNRVTSSRNLAAATRPPITTLDLSEQGTIGGKIPSPGIGRLSSLESLILRKNVMTGTMPAAMGDLLNLRVLDLSCNNFTGTIPTSLRNCKNLEIINLFQNKFEIPEIVNLSLNGTSSSCLFVAPRLLLELPNLRAVDLCENNYGLFERSVGMINVTENVAFIAEICAHRGVQLRLPDGVVAELDRMVTSQNTQRPLSLSIETKVDESQQPINSPSSIPMSPRSAKSRKLNLSAFTASATDKQVTDRSKFYWLHHNHKEEEEVAMSARSGAGSLIVHHNIDLSEICDDAENGGQVTLRNRLWDGFYKGSEIAEGSLSIRYSDAYGVITHAGVVDKNTKGGSSNRDDDDSKQDDFYFYNTNSKRHVSTGVWGVIVAVGYTIMLALQIMVSIVVIAFFGSQQRPQLDSSYGVITQSFIHINSVFRLEVIWAVVLLFVAVGYTIYLFGYEYLSKHKYNYTAFVMHAVVCWSMTCSAQILNLCIVFGYLYKNQGKTSDVMMPFAVPIANLVPDSFNAETLMYGCYTYISVSSAYSIWFLHDMLRNRIKQFAYQGLASRKHDDNDDDDAVDDDIRRLGDDKATISHMQMDRLDKLFCPLLCFINCRFPSLYIFVCRVFEVWTISACLSVGVLLLGIPSIVLIIIRLTIIFIIAFIIPACCQPKKISIDDALYICCERSTEFDVDASKSLSKLVSTSGQSLVSEMRNLYQTMQRGFLLTVSPYWVEDVQSGLFAMGGRGSCCMMYSTAKKLNRPGMLRYKIAVASSIAVSVWCGLVFLVAFIFYDFPGTSWFDMGFTADFLFVSSFVTFVVYSLAILAYTCFAFKCMKFACYYSA